MKASFLKTVLLTGSAVFLSADPVFAESPSAELAQGGGQPYNTLPVNAPPGAPSFPTVPGNPLIPSATAPPPGGNYGHPPVENMPQPPQPEISDVPPAPQTEPPPSLNGLFDLSQLPNMPVEDPFNSPGSSTHRYPQSEKSEEQNTIEQFDYSAKTVIFYLPCKGGKGASCKKHPLLTNQRDAMFRYDKNRNINISGIGNTKDRKPAGNSEPKKK